MWTVEGMGGVKERCGVGVGECMGLVEKCVGVWGKVSRDVGGGKERFGMWGPNTSVPSGILTSVNLPK